MEHLPTELVSNIFIRALPEPTPYYFNYNDDPSPLHAALCSTCQRWNQIAISTPDLWTFIHLAVGRNDHSVIKRRIALSGSRPLDVVLTIAPNAERYLTENEILDLVRKQAWRWRSLKVLGLLRKMVKLQVWIPQSVPMLREFDLYTGVRSSWEDYVDDIEYPEDLKDDPNPKFWMSQLKRCNINQFYFLGCLEEPSTIRHLRLDGSNEWGGVRCDVSLLGSIPSLPNLEILEFTYGWQNSWLNDGADDDLEFEGSQSGQQPWLCFPRLKAIRFDWTGYDVVHVVFSRLDAPKLDMVVLGPPLLDTLEQEFGNKKLPILSLALLGKPITTVRIVGAELCKLQDLIEDIPSYASHSFQVEFIPSRRLIPPKDFSFSEWPNIPCKIDKNSSEWKELSRAWAWVTASISDLKWLRPLQEGEEFDSAEGIAWDCPSLEVAFDMLEQHRQSQISL
ncbi:hypothetical protein FS837_005837 [Tulasnella sp. UAMH 9824]|nr:hypothetical protein FS837_005837 [Tulasnella sp. UAMH 9824]